MILVAAFKSSVVEMAVDLHGNHVIHICLNKLSEYHKNFIYTEVVNDCMAVSTSKNGCCII
jgi:hypothetical protein